MKTLEVLTNALNQRGLDYTTTLDASGVHVRLYDRLSDVTIGESSKNSLEEALAEILATSVSGYGGGYTGLSRL